MKLEQKTVTTIVAEEGKILVRKETGVIAGERVTLGFDYYMDGIGHTQPRLSTPDDYVEMDLMEATNPDGTPYNVVTIDHVKRLQATRRRLKEIEKEMQGLNLAPAQALEVADFYPSWGEADGLCEGDTIKSGTRFRFAGELWEVLQTHRILPHYEPSADTAALYVRVADGNEAGTLDNPVLYSGNMALVEGRIYRDSTDGLIYRCIRSSDVPVYHALSALAGVYVEVV